MFLFVRLWKKITFMFNATSRRKTKSTEKQLIKLAQNMRQQEQKKLDNIQRQAKHDLSAFKRSCYHLVNVIIFGLAQSTVSLITVHGSPTKAKITKNAHFNYFPDWDWDLQKKVVN